LIFIKILAKIKIKIVKTKYIKVYQISDRVNNPINDCMSKTIEVKKKIVKAL